MKDDLTLMTNYRGISLMPIPGKIYNKTLLNWIRPHIDPLLCKKQVGFRPGRSCAQQINTPKKNILMKHGRFQLPLIIIVVDLKKALDSIHRSVMFAIQRLGILETLPFTTAARVRFPVGPGLNVNLVVDPYSSSPSANLCGSTAGPCPKRGSQKRKKKEEEKKKKRRKVSPFLRTIFCAQNCQKSCWSLRKQRSIMSSLFKKISTFWGQGNGAHPPQAPPGDASRGKATLQPFKFYFVQLCPLF